MLISADAYRVYGMIDLSQSSSLFDSSSCLKRKDHKEASTTHEVRLRGVLPSGRAIAFALNLELSDLCEFVLEPEGSESE